MKSNTVAGLRERLKLIKQAKKTDINQNKVNYTDENIVIKGFQICGYNVQKREINVPLHFKITNNLPKILHILIPDLCARKNICKEDFVFFDLETTGLHGGSAGTAAFLSAFGKITENQLKITQYLLLDYPGINDFLENIIQEFNNKKSIIVTYNGKSFDSQVLKTMCLLNRIKPPEYYHADLLHPSRRLWKSIINDCSQGSIEKNILGLERKDDIPGSQAPDIWFDFLKTGETERLIGICDHNIYDIKGLAAILAQIIKIAEDMFNTNVIDYDSQRLAISVYKYAYKQIKLENYREPLELIKKAIESIPKKSFWYNKLLRRKLYLEKKLNN